MPSTTYHDQYNVGGVGVGPPPASTAAADNGYYPHNFDASNNNITSPATSYGDSAVAVSQHNNNNANGALVPYELPSEYANNISSTNNISTSDELLLSSYQTTTTEPTATATSVENSIIPNDVFESQSKVLSQFATQRDSNTASNINTAAAHGYNDNNVDSSYYNYDGSSPTSALAIPPPASELSTSSELSKYAAPDNTLHPSKKKMKKLRKLKTVSGVFGGSVVGGLTLGPPGLVIGAAVGGLATNKICKAGERRAQRKYEKESFQQHASTKSINVANSAVFT
jgi:hypothetical protein